MRVCRSACRATARRWNARPARIRPATSVPACRVACWRYVLVPEREGRSAANAIPSMPNLPPSTGIPKKFTYPSEVAPSCRFAESFPYRVQRLESGLLPMFRDDSFEHGSTDLAVGSSSDWLAKSSAWMGYFFKYSSIQYDATWVSCVSHLL